MIEVIIIFFQYFKTNTSWFELHRWNEVFMRSFWFEQELLIYSSKKKICLWFVYNGETKETFQIATKLLTEFKKSNVHYI